MKTNFDPQKTKHSMGLQNSQYLYIEENPQKISDLCQFDADPEEMDQMDHPINGGRRSVKPKDTQNSNFYISYQHERDVEKKREMFMVWQKTFLCKHEHIKDIGQRLLTVKKLEEFIEANIDWLYENRNTNVIHLLFDEDMQDLEKVGELTKTYKNALDIFSKGSQNSKLKQFRDMAKDICFDKSKDRNLMNLTMPNPLPVNQSDSKNVSMEKARSPRSILGGAI